MQKRRRRRASTHDVPQCTGRKGKNKVFRSANEAFNLLGCERLEYHPGSGEKNVWYVTMPKFVDYKPTPSEPIKKKK